MDWNPFHHKPKTEHDPELDELQKIERIDERIEADLDRIADELAPHQSGFVINQLQGESLMPITGIVAGAVGTFQETPTPPGAVIPKGSVPVWTTSDTTNTSLTPSADGTQVSVAVSAAATITTFNLTVANQDGTFPTTVAVPVLPPAPPPQTGFAINQLS